jgi:hypothetical protein
MSYQNMTNFGVLVTTTIEVLLSRRFVAFTSNSSVIGARRCFFGFTIEFDEIIYHTLNFTNLVFGRSPNLPSS